MAYLYGKKFFSSFDLTSGFYQIPVHENSMRYTAFMTPLGIFQWRVLPMGLLNSPSAFNKWLEDALVGIDLTRYVDDVFMGADTEEEHFRQLRAFFERCQAEGILLKPSKAKIFSEELYVLGYILTKDGIRPDPRKTEALKLMKPPSTRKETRTFLGMTGFYRRFVEGMSSLAKPLYDAVASKKFIWGGIEQLAFDEIVSKLCGDDVMLRYPDPTRPYYLHVDASGKGLGAVLMQIDGTEEGHQQPGLARSYRVLQSVVGTT